MVRALELELCSVANRAARTRDSFVQTYFLDKAAERLHSIETIVSLMDREFAAAPYYGVTPAVRDAWACETQGLNEALSRVWGATLLAHLIAMVPRRLPAFPMAPTILPHTITELSRILNDLERDPPEVSEIGSDLFLKDLGICRLDVFPCRAQIVDKNSGLPRRAALRGFLRGSSQIISLGLRTSFAFKPFFEIHTHVPMLKWFNPQGWDECYLLVADLLRLYTNYFGLVGVSWFYDPQLDRVSPRLSYLRERPLSGSAFLLRSRSTPGDVANATATSETRRRLYQAGKYNPESWFLVWPRNELLRWADQNRDAIRGKSAQSEPK